ncbi:MAG: TolC family protein [Deltaproteobacteria bacterium]|nr:TolC family protein [Deltaproteobacteria bacterium]
MTLLDCFQAALKQSEMVAISDSEIRAARARYQQVLGTLLPHLSVNASELLQDTSGNDGTDSSVGSTFTRFSRPEVAVTLTQNIFQGVKAVNGLKLARADKSRFDFLRHDAERLLFADVATVFYSIAQTEREIATTREIVGVLRQRVGEVKKWVDLGKARRSEMAAQEAELALLEAELEAKKGDKTIAYEAMAFLTGLDPQPPVIVKNYPTGKLKSLDDYIKLATSRSDIEAAKKGMAAAEGNLGVKKGDLYPQIDLEANYYPYRVGFQKEIKWDALFTLNLPIFNWETYGAIREAKSEKKQAELTAQQTERKTASEVKQAYADYQAAQRELKRYRTAAQKAKESYFLQIEDWRLGLIDNLDVLQTQRTWLSALRSFDAAEIASRLAWTKLQISAGVIPGGLPQGGLVP